MALSRSTLNSSNILYYTVIVMNENNYHVSSCTHTILLSQATIHGWESTSGLVEGEPIGDQLARETRSQKAEAVQVS